MSTPKVALLLPLVLLLIFPVHAAKPSVATGGIAIQGTLNPSDIRTASDNTFAKFGGIIASFNGGIDGEGVLSGSLILHNSTGLLLATGQIAFTGTVMGSGTGSAVVLLEEKVTFAPGGFPLQTQSIEGHLVLTNGSDGLSGLHGEGDFTATFVGGLAVLSYSVAVHFDP